jgi:hypothetical protein
MMCKCGADGHYACSPCSTGGAGNTGGGAAGTGGGPVAGDECLPGGTCQPGGPGCGSGSTGGACRKCDCGADGHYKCSPCSDTGGADAGAPQQPPVDCEQGAACTAVGQGCGGGGAAGCMKCMCGADLKLACTPCA